MTQILTLVNRSNWTQEDFDIEVVREGQEDGWTQKQTLARGQKMDIGDNRPLTIKVRPKAVFSGVESKPVGEVQIIVADTPET